MNSKALLRIVGITTLMLFLGFANPGYVSRAEGVMTNVNNRTIVTCGGRHGLIINSDGTLWGWGNDHWGQLGGAYNDKATQPMDGAEWISEPVRIQNVLGAVSVAAGNIHSLVLKWDKTVWAFGDNEYGQLGLGDTTDRHAPTLIPGLAATTIECGQYFSVAILNNGNLKAWGQNDSGQIGVGSKSPGKITSPSSVLGPSNIVAVACGNAHALALASDGTVWAWGKDSHGQLGDNNNVDRPIPVKIPALSGVMAVAAGQDFSMVLKSNGTVYVWGEGGAGRLGLGTTTDRIVPTLNPSLSNICQIRAASRQGYALDTNGMMWSWGDNGRYFQEDHGWALGFPKPYGMVSSPTNGYTKKLLYLANPGPKVYDTEDPNSGDYNARHVCACIDEDGKVRLWGIYSYGGQLGDGGSPKVVGNDVDWGYLKNLSSKGMYPGAFSRGGNDCIDLASFVLPLDFQTGKALSNTGGIVTNLLPFFTNSVVAYHYNQTNSSVNGQTDLSLRIPYQNPIVAFGSRVGGSPLYTQRSYRFVAFAGKAAFTNDYPFLNDYANTLKMDVYSKSTFSLVGSFDIPVPYYLLTNGSWSVYLTNGLKSSSSAFGLTTTISTREYPFAYGLTNSGALELSHEASDAATNYIFVIKIKGLNGNGWMSLYQNLTPSWEPLYTMEFDQAWPWNIRFLSDVQFEKQPLPPFYDGKSVEEILSTKWVVTNTIQVPNAISSYTNLDQSPELRRHPILDKFVESLKRDPLAIARFVQNEIDLTDTLDPVSGSLKLGGVNRSALGTYLERQGSPTEQCSLLIYLLRQAGVPAVYAFPTNLGCGMLDSRLSKMLRIQFKGAVDSVALTTNSIRNIAVNYPWVAAYVDNKWIHLFPWIKDTEIIEGPNIFDFMPASYDNAMKWVVGYINNRPEIVGLGDPNDTPETLFPRFVQQYLNTNAPGIAFDELGIRATNRKKAYNSWDEFPTPTSVVNTNLVADTLSDASLTNASFSAWNPNIFPPDRIFNTAQIQITYQNDSSNIIDSGVLRCCDLHDRPLLILHERTDTNRNNSSIRIKLALASYRPGIATINGFTNDASLLSAQALAFTNALSGALNAKVTLTRYRAGDNPDTISRTMSINSGDLNALCLNFGRVTKEMLEPIAEVVWNMERQISATPSITNSLTVDQYQGPLTYLMGMAYYEKVNRFMPTLSRLFKRTPVTTIAIGSARLIAKRSTNPYDTDGFPSGPMKYIQPSVDMFFNERFTAGSPTARPDSGEIVNYANDWFNILAIVDGSAKEHDVINSFYNASDSISTVKLLQLAAQRNSTNSTYKPILVVNQQNVHLVESNSFFGVSSSSQMDSSIWSKVVSAVVSSDESQAFVTPGSIENDTKSYKGTGALIVDRKGSYAAYISGNANGGWGPYIPDYTFSSANLANVWLNVNWAGNYSVSYQPPSSLYNPLAFDSFDAGHTWSICNSAWNNFFTYTPFSYQQTFQSANYLNVGGVGGFNNLFGNSVFTSESRSFLGWLSDGLKQTWSAVHDPVHAVSGEFYVDTVDLTLVGPLPLEIRRNYSSLNTADNQFGVGWKMAFTPYLSVTTNGTVMYAAEPDGSVLAYEPTATNVNVWLPTLLRNPQQVNNRTEGIGSTANLMLSRMVQTNQSGKTNFYLYSPNGDTRLYQQMAFPINLGTNYLERAHPYLVQWTDSRSNALFFTHGTNTTSTDYGQLIRVDSSSGAYLQFRYDVYGHIVEAYSGDGRHLHYQYDDFGDLVKVSLADASEISYEYKHDSQSVTNRDENPDKITQEPYSMHLLVKEIKPEGRTVANVYDDQRRVTVQSSTVGTDLNLITNALFTYNNNFVLTNSVTNTISGYTLIADVFNKVTRYDYTNSRITKITDPLGQTTEQIWYDDNTGQTGYYPRSVWKSKDKRGLWTEFRYDSFGNVTNAIRTGALTGLAGTQTATNKTRFDTNQLPIVLIDAIGNSNVIRYDAAFKFLPKEIVSYKQGVAISTNEMFYDNVTNTVSFGNVQWTNKSFGLLLKQVNAYNSPDAATNEWRYDGSGFVTNQIQYTSTTDPNITNWMFYNGRGELFKRMDAAGRTYRFDYDGLGRVISEEAYEPGATIPLWWNYSYYNHDGEKTWSDGPQYDPEDYVWCDYDGAGRKTAEVRWRSRVGVGGTVEAETGDNLYSVTSYEYDAFGNLIKQMDPVGNYSVMQYDAIGQMTKKVFYAADGTSLCTNLFSYEPGGEVTALTNGLGGVAQTLFTQSGKPYFKLFPDGSTNGWQYDLSGRPLKEFQPNAAYWESTYLDSARKLARQFKDSSGTVLASVTNVFDRHGNVITNIDASGAVFFYDYDGLSRLKMSGGPATVSGLSTQRVSYVYYDGTGIWQTNKDSLGKLELRRFDAIQRPVLDEIHDVYGGGDTLVEVKKTFYGANHHAVQEIVGSGTLNTNLGGVNSSITNMALFDSFGNTVAKLRYIGPTTNDVYYSQSAYDASGRLTRSIDEFGRTTMLTYDGMGRVKTKTLGDGATVQNNYNAEGGLTSMSMPGGLAWSATYNAANQQTSEKISNGASITRQITTTIPNNGPLAGLPTQKIDVGRSITVNYTYDTFRRLITNSASGTLPEHTLVTTFQYDRRGSVTNYIQTSGINPSTAVTRKFSGYGDITNETVSIGGVTQSQFKQVWDGAGRRRQLSQIGAGSAATINYSYQVDDLIWQVQQAGTNYFYGYEDNGLLAIRQNPWRQQAISSRMWNGAPAQLVTYLFNPSYAWLTEKLTYNPDGTLYSYSAQRPALLSGQTIVNGAWSEDEAIGTASRIYWYTYRNQLLLETLGITPTNNAAALYLPDANQLGVRSLAMWWGGWNYGWSALSLTPFQQIAGEGWFQSAFNEQANGTAVGATSVSLFMDGTNQPAQLDSAGNWTANLKLAPGSHTLNATAQYPVAQYSKTSSSTFNVAPDGGLTNYYDGAGNITNRVFSNGKTQVLKWDADGRLVRVVQRDSPNNGFDWAAIYDALGRRVRTLQTNIVNGVVQSRQTNDSYFDPQVEFGEIAVAVNGVRTWKVVGPDSDGRFGSMQGVGGLENTISENGATNCPIISDYFGHAAATVSNYVGFGFAAQWSPTRMSGYGPVPGYNPPVLAANVRLGDATLWKSKRIDPTGFYWLGARYYDSVGGRFLSPDPAGFAGSTWDLYSFANNDPINQFDPDGRFGKQIGHDLYSGYLNRNIGMDFAQQWDHQMALNRFWGSYYQTEADMYWTRNQGYFQPETPSLGKTFSQAFNMIPFFGGVKEYVEKGYTGRDMFTGERVDPLTGWSSFGIGVNVVSGLGMMGGVMSEAAQGARFGPGFANWEARNVVSWGSRGAAETGAGAPMTGYTWNQVFQARYGAANVEWVAPKMASKPLTLGVLRTPAGEFELASGWNGYGGLMPKGASGFDIVTRTHVEGQAAALMQKQGINEGLLYINNPAICPSCTRNLPYMLGPGRSLQVVPFNGSGVLFRGQ